MVFVERSRFDIVRSLDLPCGQCIGCRLERSRQWAVRCLHEAALHPDNCFVTLTYRDDQLPPRGSLDYSHFQKFMKRLRKDVRVPVRFYMCGEYGEQLGRPHFHACLFGFDFRDKTYWRTSPAGSKCYRSDHLERLWPFGACEIGAVTFESAGYVARYCVQKITGHNARYHYGELTPEFNRMSLKPGIGARWLEKFRRDVYPHDYVVVRGHETKPPRYYDKLHSVYFPEEIEEITFRREQQGRSRYQDNTLERLSVKEQVTTAATSQLHRSSI